MSLETCKASLRDYTKSEGIRITEAELSRLAKEMDKELQGNPTPAKFLATMMEKVNGDMAKRSAAIRAGRLMDLAVTKSLLQNAQELPKNVSLAEFMRNFYEGGSLKSHAGSNIDVAGMTDLYKTEFDRVISSKMSPELKRIFESDSLGVEPWKALDAIQRGVEIPKDVSPEAAEIARVIHDSNEYRSAMKASVNPSFVKTEGYFVGRNWDSEKVFGDGSPKAKQEWIDFILTNFGKKTFEDLSPLEKQTRLSEDWQNIVNGNPSASGGGTRSQMSKGRSYVANDYQAEYLTNQKYGSGTLAQAVSEQNITDARQISRLRKFTNDPEAQAKLLYDGLVKIAKERGDVKQLDELVKDKKFILQASKATALGEASAPARGYWPKTLDSTMKMMSVALTGGSAFSTVPDLALAARTVVDSTGRSMGEVHAGLMRYYTKGLTDAVQAKAFSDAVGLYTRTHAANLMRDYGLGSTPTAGIVGKWIFKPVDRLSQNFSRWNGMERIMAAERYSTGAVVSHALAEDVFKPYESLSEQQRAAGERYGFTPEKWKTYKEAVTEIPGEEGKFLTPGSVMQLSDEVIEGYLRKTGQWEGEKSPPPAVRTKARMDLAEPVAAMIYDHAQIGSSTPGTRQRAFFYRGQSINDGMGQFWRLVWQLKQSAAVSADAMRRSYYSGEMPLQGALTGPAALAAELLVLTSLAYWAKEAITRGKTPEDPRTLHFASNIVARSGIGMIYGDILAQSLDRNGLTDKALALFEGAAGPVLSQGIEALATGAEAATTRKLPKARVSQFLTNTLAGPLQNHIVVGPIWNYYFTNAMREKLNPGYIGKLVQKANKTPGVPGLTPNDRQQYFILDPRTAPRW